MSSTFLGRSFWQRWVGDFHFERIRAPWDFLPIAANSLGLSSFSWLLPPNFDQSFSQQASQSADWVAPRSRPHLPAISPTTPLTKEKGFAKTSNTGEIHPRSNECVWRWGYTVYPKIVLLNGTMIRNHWISRHLIFQTNPNDWHFDDVNGGRVDLLDPAARQSVRALVLHGFLHATTAALETAVPGTMGTCTGKLYIWWLKK